MLNNSSSCFVSETLNDNEVLKKLEPVQMSASSVQPTPVTAQSQPISAPLTAKKGPNAPPSKGKLDEVPDLNFINSRILTPTLTPNTEYPIPGNPLLTRFSPFVCNSNLTSPHYT